MNLEFSPEALEIRDQGRRFLTGKDSLKRVRAALDGSASVDLGLWQEMAELGWAGAAIPEEYGGHGIGYEVLCVIAEELGASLAPVPFLSTVAAAEALMMSGSDEQKQAWLPKIADGSATGTYALTEGEGRLGPDAINARFEGGKLTGAKWPVADAETANIAVVAAKDGSGKVVQVLVDLTSDGVKRTALNTLDPSRPQARIDFDGVSADLLPANDDQWTTVQAVLDRVAVLAAFEEIGGAQACLDMAVAYAKDRYAFGRPIGSNQAIKHKLADMYIAIEIARSNAYIGTLDLTSGTRDIALTAATARVASIEAYIEASSENIQTHGGIGFTWEADPQLYYRRANQTALSLGTLGYWKDRLVEALKRQDAA
jgi:alkylation response protein AidB-like acyl-CoA dehydrogenase